MTQPNNIAQEVQNGLNKARREALKGNLKGLFADYHKSQEVSRGILDKITKALEDSGESAEGIQEILNGN